jgi:hypothetical protein
MISGRLAILALLILLVPIDLLFGQRPESESPPTSIRAPEFVDQPMVDRPFRRIFVPETELPELPLDNLRPLEIDKLPAALERIIRSNSETIDPWLSSAQGLRSIHAVARLVGADLLSERTRLTWPDPKSTASNPSESRTIQERLSPWNLAIENSYEELNPSQSTTTSNASGERESGVDQIPQSNSGSLQPAWVFDVSGSPLVHRVHPEAWIRWSLRPLADSTPNRLNFEASVPRTVDGCLVLLLPKTARLEKSNVVMRRIDGWQQAASRLGNWPDPNPTLGTEAPTAVENAYWLLEISGQERITFSIDLGTNAGRGQTIESPKQWGIERLFAKQTLQYSIHGGELRMIGEWEWNEPSAASTPIRFELPPGMKIRSLTINERETTLQLDQNTVVVNGPSGGSRQRMAAEFLIPWEQLIDPQTGILQIPSIRNSNAAVLFGSTILQDQPDGRFVEITPERGRLESVRKTPEGAHRLEYSWYRSPPDFDCRLLKPESSIGVESLIRLSNDSERCTANVRLRFSQLQKPGQRGIRTMKIPPEWQLAPQSLTSKPQANSGLLRLDESGALLQIDTNQWSNPEGIVEFQLLRSLESDAQIDLGQSAWLTLQDVRMRECVYLEPGPSNRFTFQGPIEPWILEEKELTPWQRDSLPRLGRAMVFGVRQEKLPPLLAGSIEQSLIVPIESSIRRSTSDWKITHRFPLSKDLANLSQLRILLSDGYQWHYQGEQRLPIAANFDRESQTWTIQLDSISQDASSDTIGALVATLSVPSSLPTLQITKPSVKEASRSTHSLRLSKELLVRQPDGLAVEGWNEGSGYTYTWKSSDPLTVEVIDTTKSQRPEPFFFDSRVDLFLDGFGGQVAWLATKVAFPNAFDHDIKMKVPEGWEVTDAFVSGANGDRPAVVHKEMDQTVELTVDNEGMDSVVLLRVRLLGPKAEETPKGNWQIAAWIQSQLGSSSFDVRWPKIRLTQGDSFKPTERIWYPASLSLTPKTHRSNSPLTSTTKLEAETLLRMVQPSGVGRSSPILQPGFAQTWWPIWSWSRDVWDRVGLIEGSFSERTALEIRPSDFEMPVPSGKWTHVILNSDLASQGVDFLLGIPSGTRLAGWIVVFAALFSAGFYGRWAWGILILSMLCLWGGFWLAPEYAQGFQQGFLGLCCGGILYQLYQTFRPLASVGPPSLRSDRSSLWDPKEQDLGIEPAGADLAGSRPSALLVLLPWVLLPTGLATLALGTAPWSYSQDPSIESARVFDILIPIDSKGEVSGNTIYVPEELLRLVEQADRQQRQRESNALVCSSRHYLRLDSRSFGFGNADQPLTSNYEFWIGEAAVGKALRIPYPAETLKLSRFSVDGIEVLSGRFSKSETELVWFPDRPGRRSIQIESQVRLQSVDAVNTPGTPAGDKRATKVWAINAEILPVSNGLVEVETDGAWTINLAAMGRSTNPSAGRHIVQLGNRNRLEGFLQPPSSIGNRGSLLTMPTDPSPTNPEYPTMNTELLVDHEHLIARTVIEYPGNLSTGGEVEIESDSQWLPIGSQWGDATLVDVRTGSTLDRQRYVVRWNPIDASESDPSGATSQKRSIVTTWVPVGDASLRSILFAECRDRRVRQGVLRYARSAGAIWTLDGISSWIPAINAKDRLEWPELKDPPLTTNLRIPLSSGFGVLRRQSVATSDQLSASHKLHAARDAIRWTTTIKLTRPLSAKNSLVLEIPQDYQVERVQSVTGALEFIAWTKQSKNYVQVLVDRQGETINDLVVESSKSLTAQSALPSDALPSDALPSDAGSKLLVAWPELKSSTGSTTPPSYTLSADPTWRVVSQALPTGNGMDQQGLGDGRVLLETIAADQIPEPFILQPVSSVWDGALVVRLPETSADARLQVYGISASSETQAWQGVELSVPKDLVTSWVSENPVREIGDLRWNYRSLLIDPTLSDLKQKQSKAYDFLLELPQEAGAAVNWKALQGIEVHGQKTRRLWVLIPNSQVAQQGDGTLGGPMESGQAPGTSEDLAEGGSARSAKPTRIDWVADQEAARIFKVLGLNDQEWKLRDLSKFPSGESVIANESIAEFRPVFAKHLEQSPGRIASEFWIESSPGEPSRSWLTWRIAQDWTCEFARVNGKDFRFAQEAGILEVFYPPLDSDMHVELWFSLATDNSAWSDALPTLDSSQGVGQVTNGQVIVGQAHSPLELAPWVRWLQRVSRAKDPSVDSRSDSWRYAAGRLAQLLEYSTIEKGSSNRRLSQEEFTQGVNSLSNLPWRDLEDYRSAVQRASIASLESQTIGEEQETLYQIRQSSSVARSVGYPLLPFGLSMTILLASYLYLGGNHAWLQKRPWWNLLCVALAWWLLTGDLWVPVAAGLLAALLVIDTYWMLSVQFRQTGIRGPR